MIVKQFYCSFEGGQKQLIQVNKLEFQGISQRKTRSENEQILLEIEQLVADEELPESQRQQLVKFQRIQRDYFDRIHPSKWAGIDKSRGWVNETLASEYNGKYDPRVVVHYPQKFKDDFKCSVKGAFNGTIIDQFETQGLWGITKHFVFVPGNTDALVDVGGYTVNYGTPINELPVNSTSYVYSPDYRQRYCLEVYTPSIVKTSGLRITKEKEYLD